MSSSENSDLLLPAHTMRSMGYRVIDALVDHWTTLNDQPAMRVSSREELESRLREDLPGDPSEFEKVLEVVLKDVLGSIGHLNHPRFFGFIPSPSNWISAMADTLAAGVTPFCGTWLEGSGPTQIELTTLDWLKQLLDYPRSAAGLFVSGGSIANLTALAVARDSKPSTDVRQHVIYQSDQTHSSVDRALKILGYGSQQTRKLPSDGAFRLNIADLENTVRSDRTAGHIPHIVIANAGATNTGSVDSLNDIARICAEERLWMHVDGAYGAAAAISARGARLLDGIGLADSITLDPHKWLFQPYAMGCVLVRDAKALTNFFHVMPEYLRDTETDLGEVNLCDYGPELTRPFRALKLWMSLKVFGAGAFVRAVEHGLRLAETTENMLRQDGCWEIVSPAQLAIICFRYVRPGLTRKQVDEMNTSIARQTAEDGTCFLSTTRLHDRPVLRMCTIQVSTSKADLRLAIDRLRACGDSLQVS